MNKVILDNDLFVSKNLAMLVKKYRGQRIVISCGHIFTGFNAVKKAKTRFPDVIPLSFPVPGPEEFMHIL